VATTLLSACPPSWLWPKRLPRRTRYDLLDVKEVTGKDTDHIQPFALSLNAPFIPQFFKEQLDQTAPYWDYIVGNETEAAAYAESHDLKTTDIPTIAKHLANLPKKNEQRKRIAIITQGTEPTVVAIQGEDDVKSFPVHAINKSEIADTTGAGDAFAAGFFAGVAKGEALERSIDMGQWLAALSIREEGPRCVQKSGFPDSHNSSTDSIHQIPVSQADLLPVFLDCD
jgi:sugar/nucleoside kinase (ribokinase family)